MHTIDVDFEVLKALMVRRETEEVTYNAVIRKLLDLDPTPAREAPASSRSPSPQDWLVKGVRFPIGTEFRATHSGKTHFANVHNGALVMDHMRYESPSSAATAITGYAVNGWLFWECRVPGTEKWRSMDSFRQ